MGRIIITLFRARVQPRRSRSIVGLALVAALAVPLAATTSSSAAVASAASVVAVKASAPTITGTRVVGKSLKAKITGWKPTGLKLKYTWKVSGKVVKHGTSATYKPVKKDVGKRVAVSVIGAKKGFASVKKTSSSVVVLPAGTKSWLSGASGAGAASGSFGDWRGSDVGIVGTWSDNDANMVQLWPLRAGGPLSDWSKPVDVAIGAFDSGESWSAAAKGKYDRRWITSLRLLASLRGNKATTYIRFAHEMNGNWYPWSVNKSNYVAFDKAWIRFRALQKKYFPSAELVFNVNRESVGTGMDWRDFFPGSYYVDVMSVDYYNQYPYVGTAATWKKSLTDVDAWGAPKGLSKYLAFAKSVRLPLAVSEWAGMHNTGDSAAFVNGMHSFFDAHGGSGAGQLLYEIYFNVDQNASNFVIHGQGAKMPKAARAYKKAF